jgi:hypothetical protein
MRGAAIGRSRSRRRCGNQRSGCRPRPVSHEGPERVWARHALTAAACRAGVLAMGLRLWPADERTASPTTTAVRIPAGIEDAALRAAARARYGVVFSSGRGETLGKLVRIGHMGPTARPMYAVVAGPRSAARSARWAIWARRRGRRRGGARGHRRGHRRRSGRLSRAVDLRFGTRQTRIK